MDEEFRVMTFAERGFYLTCLDYAWMNSGLPSDPELRARVIGCSREEADKYWQTVQRKFVQSAQATDRLVNPRQEDERKKAYSKSEKATAAVQTRYNKTNERSYERSNVRSASSSASRSASVALRASDSDYESVSGFVVSSTPEQQTKPELQTKPAREYITPGNAPVNSANGEMTDEQAKAFLKSLGWSPRNIPDTVAQKVLALNPRTLPGDCEDPATLAGVYLRLQQFELLWANVWRKVGKKPAREAYFRAALDEATVIAIERGMEKAIPEMLKREMDKRPHFGTWLNQQRWQDEHAAPTERNGHEPGELAW